MMKVFLPNGSVGECELSDPNTPYLVIRALDDGGGYRRLKFAVVERAGERGLQADSLAKAALLPGFRSPEWQPGQPPPKMVELGSGAPVVPHDWGWNKGGEQEGDALELRAQVLGRILAKLEEVALSAPAPIRAAAGERVAVTVPLPRLPAGNLYLLPERGIPLAMPLVMGRAGLGHTAPAITLPLEAGAEGLELAAGAPLGRLEVRSFAELPDGMRDKVFQSHLESKIQEVQAGMAAPEG